VVQVGLGLGRGRIWLLSTKLDLIVKLAWSQHGSKASQEAENMGQDSGGATDEEAMKECQISTDPTRHPRWARGRFGPGFLAGGIVVQLGLALEGAGNGS
jgi:hypothetical protein